jgi:hypothetical protein
MPFGMVEVMPRLCLVLKKGFDYAKLQIVSDSAVPCKLFALVSCASPEISRQHDSSVQYGPFQSCDVSASWQRTSHIEAIATLP